jgi:glycerol kinase
MALQRSSVVCWDRTTGEALSPVLSWQDRRGEAWLAGFSAEAERVRERTELPLSAHYGASKLRWCLDHLPPVGAALRDGPLALGPLSSFLVFRLLEERPFVAEPAGAGRTILWSPDLLDWDDELLELFGIPAASLPRCVPTRHAFGTLAAGGQGIPLTVVAGDQSATLFAWGPPREDTAYVNLGTGAFVQRFAGTRPKPLPGLLTGVAYLEGDDPAWSQEGTVNGAGSAIARVGGELGIDHPERELHALLERPVDPPLFLNGVSGLGSPYWVPDFPSRFEGSGDAAQRMVAVAESVVFLLQVNLRALGRRRPELRRTVVTGGLARLDGLCRRLASLSGLPVERPTDHEATARGAACLAAGLPAAWGARDADRFEPAKDSSLAERFGRWEEVMTSALGR